jgi:arylsulfatase A-like enzyme/Tfp pilus assembly protein PilF
MFSPSCRPTGSRLGTHYRFPALDGLSLAVLALAGLTLTACSPAPASVDLSGANLLLITIDTLRADRIGAFGDARAATPHLDQLADNGIRFLNCYAPVPLTLPSHSSLFTGRYPFAMQVRTNGSYFLSPDEVTLAERLAENGYTTAAFVSTYILGSKFGLDQGFQHYDDNLSTGDVIHSFTSEVSADQIVDRFESWLAKEKPGRFFAWLHFYDPHLPYAPPQPFADRFGEDAYRGEIAFVDSQVGRALAAIDQLGLTDNTLIVVTSDHGESFGEHGEIGHGILTYEESLRVPLILSAGGSLPGGLQLEQRARLIDLSPTLLDLLGLSADLDAPGSSLVPIIENKHPEAQREVYFESILGSEDYNWAPITGLIAGNHKYISLPQPELYDLVSDPGERKNIHRSQPALAEEIDQRLQQLLLASADRPADSRRALTEEDLAHLRALGYLGAAERSETVVDPKQGIRIDQEIKRIRALSESGSVTEAKKEADTLAAGSDNLKIPGLYALRHEIAIRLEQEAAAIEILRQGIQAIPGSERLRFLLAHYLLQTGHLEQAADASTQLLEMNPRFSQAWIVLGQVAEAENDLQSAIAHYERALESEPGSLDLRRRRAEALLRSGDTETAASELSALAELGAFADEPEQLYRIGVLVSQAGDPLRAEELFRRGLAIAPGGVHHITFALLLLQRQELAEAKLHLEIALEDFADDLTQEQQAIASGTLRQLAAAGSS